MRLEQVPLALPLVKLPVGAGMDASRAG